MGAWFSRTSARLRSTWSSNTGSLAAGFAVINALLIVLVIVQATEIHEKLPLYSWDSVAEAFGADATLLAVAVALWQSFIARQQAKDDALEAARRFREELDAAENRHMADLAAQKESPREQVQVQKDLDRTQRLHLREQEFKQAIVRVGRAANAYTHELATLVEIGRRAAELSTKREREDALLANTKQLGILAQDINNEISGARMLTRSDALQEALNDVNAATMMGPYAEMDYRNPIINEGKVPVSIAIFQAMDAIQTAMGEARQQTGDLLITGWD